MQGPRRNEFQSRPDVEELTTKAAPDRRHRRSGLGRSLRPLLALWFCGSVAWLALVSQRSIPVEELLLDPAAIGGVAWYSGLISSLGVLCWAASVCACCATCFVAHHAGRFGARSAFGSATILFTLLLVDDLFLLHSNVLPGILGVSKPVVLGLEAMLGLVWFVASWVELRRTRWQILVAALTAFMASVCVDVFLWDEAWWWNVENLGQDFSRLTLALEDGPKFFGALALATWSTVTAADIIRSVVTNKPIVSTKRTRRQTNRAAHNDRSTQVR